MFAGLMLKDAITPTPFISSWKTNNAGTSSSTQIKVPTTIAGSYNCTVDWGDSTTSTMTTYNDAAWTHTYSIAGTYTVTISGLFVGFVFSNGNDKLKLLNISQWGSGFRLGTNQGGYFSGCSNLTITATDILNLSGTTSFNSAFSTCSSITTIPNANSWNTSSINTMGACFNGCSSFNMSLNSWDTSQVTAINSMFSNCTTFNGNVSSWNVGNVTNMASTFANCPNFNQNIGSWNVSKVTTMASCFTGCGNFNQNIGSWVTTALTNMGIMFQNCTNFNQDISGWNTSKVSSFANTFSGCTSFQQNLGGWSIAALTNAASMFSGVTLTKTNYNALLAGWGAFVTPHNSVTFSGGNSHYDATTGGYNGTAGRLLLTGTYLWTITDGGTP